MRGSLDDLTQNQRLQVNKIAEEFGRELLDGRNPEIDEYVKFVDNSVALRLRQELNREEFQHRYGSSNRYRPVAMLGEGSFGVVYLACDEQLNRYVALKVLKNTDAKSKRRFLEEASRQADLPKHAHLVALYDCGELSVPDWRQPSNQSQNAFLVMEYIDGVTLKDKLASEGPFAPELAARLMEQIAQGVSAVHQRTARRRNSGLPPLVHRDLKPGNVLLDSDGQAHLADFGLAASVSDLQDGAAEPGGSVPYMSPEQALAYLSRPIRDSIDARSDIWSLGVMLFELLTGRQPFVSNKPNGTAWQNEIFDKIQSTTPARLRDLNANIPSEFEQLVRDCLTKSVDERLQSADELATRLRGWLDSVRAVPPPFDFSARLDEARKDFVDRPWLFDEVDAWSVLRHDRLLLLVGELGSGKSAFLAELVNRNPGNRVLAWHFCQHRLGKTRRATTFVRSIAGMLASRLDCYRKALVNLDLREALRIENCEQDPAGAFEDGVVTPIGRLAPPAEGAFFVLVDALDEADDRANSAVTVPDLIASWSTRLPAWLRIVASTRRDAVLRDELSDATQLVVDRDSVNHADDVQGDVSQFIRQRLEQPNLQERLQEVHLTPDRAAHSLLRQSEVNYLYVKEALEGIERGIYSFSELDRIPPGLNALYNAFFRRRWPNDGSFKSIRPILQMLTAAPEPLHADLIAAAAHLSVYELDRLLDSLAHYVARDPLQDTVRIRLLAVSEWLTKTQSIYRVDPKYGHTLLAVACAKEFERDARAIRPYTLRYLPHHLAESARWSDVEKTITDLHFLEATVNAGLAFELSNTCDTLAGRLPHPHVAREVGKCLQSDAVFLARHPPATFQCLYNHCFVDDRAPFPALIQKWRHAYDGDPRSPAWVRLMGKHPASDAGTLHRLVGPSAPVLHLVTCMSAVRTAAFAADGRLYIWDANGHLECDLAGDENGFIVPLAFDSTGRFLLAATDQCISVLDLADDDTVERIDELPRDSTPLAAIDVEAGDRVRVLMSDGTLVDWASATGFTVSRVVEDVSLMCGALSRNGSWLALSDAGRALGRNSGGIIDVSVPPLIREAFLVNRDARHFGDTHLDLFVGEDSTELREQLRGVWQRYISLQPESGWIAARRELECAWPEADEFELYHKNAVTLWHPKFCDETLTREWTGESCESLSFANDQELLAIGMTNGRLRVVAVPGGSEKWTRKTHDDRVTALTWLPGEETLASSGSSGTVPYGRGDDNQVCIQHLKSQTEQLPDVHAVRVTVAACSSDGSMFATGDEGGRVAIWDANNGALRHLQMPRRILLDRDYKQTADPNAGVFKVWTGHPSAICSARFLPDSRLLVTASQDGSIWFWDTVTGNACNNVSVDSDIEVSPAHCWMDVSANGRVVAAMDASGAVTAWAVNNDLREVFHMAPDQAEPGALKLSDDGAILAVARRNSARGDFDERLGTPITHSYEYAIRVTELESRRELHEMTAIVPAAWQDLRLAMLDVRGRRRLLAFGAGHCIGESFLVRIWDLANGILVFDGGLTETAGGIDVAMEKIGERFGGVSPTPNTTPCWEGRPRREGGETAFSFGGADIDTAWYPAPFDGLIGPARGRVFCGYLGREVHILQIEERRDMRG